MFWEEMPGGGDARSPARAAIGPALPRRTCKPRRMDFNPSRIRLNSDIRGYLQSSGPEIRMEARCASEVEGFYARSRSWSLTLPTVSSPFPRHGNRKLTPFAETQSVPPNGESVFPSILSLRRDVPPETLATPSWQADDQGHGAAERPSSAFPRGAGNETADG